MHKRQNANVQTNGIGFVCVWCADADEIIQFEYEFEKNGIQFQQRLIALNPKIIHISLHYRWLSTVYQS